MRWIGWHFNGTAWRRVCSGPDRLTVGKELGRLLPEVSRTDNLALALTQGSVPRWTPRKRRWLPVSDVPQENAP